MTETKRLMAIQELLEEQRILEDKIDKTQVMINVAPDKRMFESNLAHYQNRLKEVQEELKKCKKDAK